jgi:hypothetical protein
MVLPLVQDIAPDVRAKGSLSGNATIRPEGRRLPEYHFGACGHLPGSITKK